MNKTTRAIPEILSFKDTNYFSQTCEWRNAKTISKIGRYWSSDQLLCTKSGVVCSKYVNILVVFEFL